MTLKEALDDSEFNKVLNKYDFPAAFSFLNDVKDREELYLLLQEEGLNPLMGFKDIPAFFLSGGSKITKIEIPDSVTSISDEAFYNCGLLSITIPNSVTSIGCRAFSRCHGLTSVVIPDSVKSIDSYAFEYCSKLTTVVIGNNVMSIGDLAFHYCWNLINVTIGNNVTSIGKFAFWNCTSLKEITCTGTEKNALTKLKVRNKRWRDGSLIKKIICSDGVIEL